MTDFKDHEITALAAMHAVSVHDAAHGPPLTPWGIATCAASMAVVLARPDHPNHALAVERLQRSEAVVEQHPLNNAIGREAA